MELSRNHIIFTLGIPVPLNESIQLSESLKLRILQEQLLYETFLDSIKNYASEKYNQVVTTIKDWKDAAAVLGKVLSDSNLLNDFLKPLERRIVKLIQPLTDFLKKNKLDSFVETITDFIDKIKSLEGWKKFMALVSVGSIITYILEKLKSLGPDVIKDFISKTFSSNFITDIVGKLTDFKSYLGWLQPIVKGVETIFNFLKPLIDAFSKAFQSGSKFATKLIRENNLTQFNMKERFQQLAGIKEAINPAAVPPTTSTTQPEKGEIKTLRTYLQSTGKSALGQINDVKELENVLNIIFDGMNSTLKSSGKLIPILNKLKTKFK
jgi:hypothetical protein